MTAQNHKPGVWDGLDKGRVSKAVLTAYMSDDYLEALAAINNAETHEQVHQAREMVKEQMALWREECPEYAFMVDCLFLFSESMLRIIPQDTEES